MLTLERTHFDASRNQRCLRRSDRSIPLEHDAVQIPDVAYGIVSVCFMHQTAIIPDHDIAGLPFVAVLEFLLGRVFEQLVEQQQRLMFRHSDNLFDADRVDIDRLAACSRMLSDDRMNDRLRGNFPSSRRGSFRSLYLL